MRKFEKVSIDEFSKYYDKKLYEEYDLPKRMTSHSAGYDFFAIEGFTLMPGEIKKIPTGYKATFGSDEMLMILVRSSMGFKYNVRMTNQVGIIESDYNNIDNEGHMFVSLQNEGDRDFVVKKGEGYAQGIFTKFLICDDDVTTNERQGGLGSTNKERNDE
ncbi:MAG TPA: dUTP diphosphatase [Candidatus Onthocola stercoravium]|nr:dUTP diphosphatase [Candidatus Onthocola stercoravium]